jgi:hypothetical protein
MRSRRTASTGSRFTIFALLCLLLAACRPPTSAAGGGAGPAAPAPAAEPRTGGVLRVGQNAADLGSLDPHYASGTQDRALVDMVFNGLLPYRTGDATSFEPDLAMMAFPSLLLGLAVLAVLGAGLEKMLLAIGIVLAPPFARLVHGAALSLESRQFVQAARAIGAGDVRIVGRHILPNLLGETVVLASLLTASAIRIEASLSFIGLGVSPPTPTWGNMLRDGAPMLLNAPWLSLFPGLAILVSVLAFNLVGDGLRDVLDPRRG